jgi:hypothetical protein
MEPWSEPDAAQGIYGANEVANHIEVRCTPHIMLFVRDYDIPPDGRTPLADLENEHGNIPIN